MNTLRHLFIVITAITGLSVAAQQTPAPSQKGAITITGATAHIGNGNTIENATIIFENGILTAVGTSSVSAKGTIINATGKHVYPGFIAPAKSLGLIEVNAVRASNDQDEIGDMIPHIRSIIAYNAESKVVESMRPNGVLIGQITPQGGTISGSSSIVQFMPGTGKMPLLKQMMAYTCIGQVPLEEVDGGLESLEGTNLIKTTPNKHKK